MAIRKRKIRALVGILLADHSVTQPPVPVERIVKARGVRLHLDALEGDISGFAYRSDDQLVIGVNTSQAAVRQRFTIAHELGHLLLHDQGRVHVDRGFVIRLRSEVSSQGTEWEEIEANRFAAELLMPEQFLREDLEGIDSIDMLDDDRIGALAKHYDVSKQALLIRLTALGYIDSLV